MLFVDRVAFGDFAALDDALAVRAVKLLLMRVPHTS